MELTRSAAIVGPLANPERCVRLGRLGDVARLFPGEDRAPTLVAASVALLEGLTRVVVAGTLEALPDDVALVAWVAPLGPDARAALRSPRPEVPLLVDLPDDASPAEVLAARARGVRYVHPGGAVLLPGQRQAIAVGGAALAMPLLFGRPSLGALCELRPSTPRTTIDEALVDAGVLVLTTFTPPRSGPRVTLPPGEHRLATPAIDADASAAPATPPGPTARLEVALGELAQRFSHRLERDPAALATLEREAQRVLQAEVATGAITRYALALQPEGDDVAIEVAVALPKRVGQVIIRVLPR